jgi:hypothetical protein
MTLQTALTCPHGCGPKVPCRQCGDLPSPVWVRLLFKPFFLVSGFWYHRRNGIWLDRGWDLIPEYVVQAGLLLYGVLLGGVLVVALGCLGQWLGWWPGSASHAGGGL